jgi:hypothetical protein
MMDLCSQPKKAKSKATNTKNPGEAIGTSIASAWIHFTSIKYNNEI